MSEGLAEICEEACKKAKEKGITVSCDLNYRKNLWSRETAGRVMAKLMNYVDVCIANEEDAQDVFGISAENTDIDSGKLNVAGYESVAAQLIERFGFSRVAITLRGSITANDNHWSAMLYDGEKSYFAKNYQIHIVDRVDGGDSFGGALIYGMLQNFNMQDTIDFAVAASCLKHTIEYDFNMVSKEEVFALMKGSGSGRVQR